jgi:hydrogenase expression/formation protein HypC
MCLAVPGEIIELSGDDPLTLSANVAFAGVIKPISLALLPHAAVGDYVLVHAGFAIAVLDPAEAARTLAAIDALDAFDPGSPPAS